MMKYHFYAHAGAGNHGCEAIVRSSAHILNSKITLHSMRPEQDFQYGLNQVVAEICEDYDAEVKKYSIPWIISRLQTKLTGKIENAIYNRKRNLIDTAGAGDVWFSIGGDNYCYPGTEILAAENVLLKRKGAKTVLWGCSIEPELLDNTAIAKDLASYDLITARETISYEALKKVNPNTVLVSDPAFTLERNDLPLPEGWIEGNTIGVNASPLILSSGNSDLVLNAYRRLIEGILKTTDCAVALIPHVVWDNNDDRQVLRILYDEYRNTGRIIMIGDCNCMELKGYIARCRMFIGARTHATIAAYSNCVPTLVLGYSVKSKGIAKDLFGTDENYVLPVKGLQSDAALADGFKWLLMHEEQIRDHLKTCMPEYINNAYRGVSSLNRLIPLN